MQTYVSVNNTTKILRALDVQPSGNTQQYCICTARARCSKGEEEEEVEEEEEDKEEEEEEEGHGRVPPPSHRLGPATIKWPEQAVKRMRCPSPAPVAGLCAHRWGWWGPEGAPCPFPSHGPMSLPIPRAPCPFPSHRQLPARQAAFVTAIKGAEQTALLSDNLIKNSLLQSTCG